MYNTSIILIEHVIFFRWKCSVCSHLITADTAHKMGWHVRIHGKRIKYTEMTFEDKVNWVHCLLF